MCSLCWIEKGTSDYSCTPAYISLPQSTSKISLVIDKSHRGLTSPSIMSHISYHHAFSGRARRNSTKMKGSLIQKVRNKWKRGGARSDPRKGGQARTTSKPATTFLWHSTAPGWHTALECLPLVARGLELWSISFFPFSSFSYVRSKESKNENLLDKSHVIPATW